MNGKEKIQIYISSNIGSELNAIAKKVITEQRITEKEGIYLFEKGELGFLGSLANYIRNKKHGDYTYFNRNFHIEPTNICVFDCKFCSYSRLLKHRQEGWELSADDILEKVKEYDGKPVTEVHIVGGVHPKMGLMYFAELIKKIKEHRPELHVKAFTAVELDFMCRKARVSYEEGLKILEEVKLTFGCPVITDIHTVSQCAAASEVVDVLQIPAFLSRQTDLLIAAGETEKPINVKKGQFLAPWEMMNVAEKIASTGNEKILLCERGTSFGYNALVNDFRGLEIMAETGYPVVFDATHSVQQPGGRGNTSGGERKFVAALARAACAVGIAAVFIETHQEPDNAPCDGPNMIDVADLQKLIEKLRLIDELSKAT